MKRVYFFTIFPTMSEIYIFFNERRKKNKKKIVNNFSNNQIKDFNLDQLYNLRAENIDNEIFFKLSDIL